MGQRHDSVQSVSKKNDTVGRVRKHTGESGLGGAALSPFKKNKVPLIAKRGWWRRKRSALVSRILRESAGREWMVFADWENPVIFCDLAITSPARVWLPLG